MRIIDRDIELYTAFVENSAHALMGCEPENEKIWQARLITEKIILAEMINLKILIDYQEKKQ